MTSGSSAVETRDNITIHTWTTLLIPGVQDTWYFPDLIHFLPGHLLSMQICPYKI